MLEKIVDAFAPCPDQHVLEIGPGRGALTIHLLRSLKKLNAVELDRDLIAALEQQFADRLVLFNRDALKFKLSEVATEVNPVRIIGNLPYNISTPLIFKLLEQKHLLTDMLFMLQREVVDRMVAPVGGHDYGRLSVMVQYFCEVEKRFDVAAESFTPPPKVVSSVITLTPKVLTLEQDQQVARFARIVKTAFMYRRKTLRNALKKECSTGQIEAADIAPDARPQNLGIEDYRRLAEVCMAGE
ncbi:MAG: 16S rRNA (adenine(1518)-N(6)/adenine(1519)-N(6))-dimethyltransferase RsmA [Arenicellales bacterium WSBS_2016_MAG_OTU3]